jgi:hypothetical protein
MGLFYEAKPGGQDHVAAAIEDALQEEPANVPNKAAEAKKRAAKAKQDAQSDPPVLKTARVAVAVLIAAALIVGAVLLSAAMDNQAIAEAAKKVATPTYVSPDLTGLKTAADWLRTLGAAWSAALVAALLSEKAAATQGARA